MLFENLELTLAINCMWSLIF